RSAPAPPSSSAPPTCCASSRRRSRQRPSCSSLRGHDGVSVDDLRLTPDRLAKPVPGGLAVETTLQHFAIVTYHVDPSALRAHLHARFEPVCVTIDGAPRALVSVVSFLDRDFRFVAFPYVKASFGQTNYRAYVRDTENGDHVAWFFGT